MLYIKKKKKIYYKHNTVIIYIYIDLSGDALDYKEGLILTGSYRNYDQIQLWDLKTMKFFQEIKWDNINCDQAYVYSC